jgi:hypothetical protein
VSTRALQSFFVFHATIEDFKIEILICFNLLITEHWTSLHHSFIKLSNFCNARSTTWNTTSIRWAWEEDEQCVRISHLSSYMFAHWPIHPSECPQFEAGKSNPHPQGTISKLDSQDTNWEWGKGLLFIYLFLHPNRRSLKPHKWPIISLLPMGPPISMTP